jgi:hypothetical protein
MDNLDWGHVTPEGYNRQTNVVLHVFGHDLSSLEKIDRTVRFIVGRVIYYELHVPAGATHFIKIDARGQDISEATATDISNEIIKRHGKPDLLKVEVIR